MPKITQAKINCGATGTFPTADAIWRVSIKQPWQYSNPTSNTLPIRILRHPYAPFLFMYLLSSTNDTIVSAAYKHEKALIVWVWQFIDKRHRNILPRRCLLGRLTPHSRKHHNKQVGISLFCICIRTFDWMNLKLLESIVSPTDWFSLSEWLRFQKTHCNVYRVHYKCIAKRRTMVAHSEVLSSKFIQFRDEGEFIDVL